MPRSCHPHVHFSNVGITPVMAVANNRIDAYWHIPAVSRVCAVRQEGDAERSWQGSQHTFSDCFARLHKNESRSGITGDNEDDGKGDDRESINQLWKT